MISGATCYSCLRQFHTRERYLNQIRYAPKSCYATGCFVGNFLTNQEPDEIDNNLKLFHRQQAAALHTHSKALKHSVRMIGPLPFVSHLSTCNNSITSVTNDYNRVFKCVHYPGSIYIAPVSFHTVPAPAQPGGTAPLICLPCARDGLASHMQECFNSDDA